MILMLYDTDIMGLLLRYSCINGFIAMILMLYATDIIGIIVVIIIILMLYDWDYCYDTHAV